MYTNVRNMLYRSFETSVKIKVMNQPMIYIKDSNFLVWRQFFISSLYITMFIAFSNTWSSNKEGSTVEEMQETKSRNKTILAGYCLLRVSTQTPLINIYWTVAIYYGHLAAITNFTGFCSGVTKTKDWWSLWVFTFSLSTFSLVSFYYVTYWITREYLIGVVLS